MQALVHYIPIDAPGPSLTDNTADIDRLLKQAQCPGDDSCPEVPFSCLSRVARRFRQGGFHGHAIINDLPSGKELVDFVAEEETLYGMALDLGTTHLAAELIDLQSGEVVGHAGCPNSQIQYGADILTRIHYAAKQGGLRRLHDTIIADVNGLAEKMAAQAGCNTRAIRALTVAGNTTMTHLFLQLDPYHLCREPYIPLINAVPPFHAGHFGLCLDIAAPVWVLPNVGSYFGGDLVAGILASEMWRKDEVSMLIDVGTNAEVVIGNKDWLMACAGAAGPALEGGIARMGMRAMPGAIERVTIDVASGAVALKTIGDKPAKGICGSGMIDLVAAMYLAGIIDMRGKYRQGSHDRVVVNEDGPAFMVAGPEESENGNPVLLSQIDLDNMIRSKAAMYAILKTLINQVGMTFEQLGHIYVAGAFGQHIDPRGAMILGMLPDLPLEKFSSIGNSSLAGAKLLLLDQQSGKKSEEIGSYITYMELNVNHDFMNRFSGARFIPHTDHHLFPSVPHFDY